MESNDSGGSVCDSRQEVWSQEGCAGVYYARGERGDEIVLGATVCSALHQYILFGCKTALGVKDSLTIRNTMSTRAWRRL